MKRGIVLWLLPTLPILAALAVYTHSDEHGHDWNALNSRLGQIVPVGKHTELSCASLAAARPLVLLVLGQSNAANHGALSARPADPVTLIADGKCVKATDPLPGGTGTGGSIWQLLPAMLARGTVNRPVVFSVLAVDSTSIDDWTNGNSPLRGRLESQVASMRRLRLMPDFVVWQQGELDARIGTSQANYEQGLHRLAHILAESGVNAPIILARSTICRSAPSSAIRSAVEAITTGDRRFRLGPDTDVLSGEILRDGCHLTLDGLDSAARMWAKKISDELPTIGSDRQ